MAYKAKFLHFKTKQSYNTERNKTSEGSDERKIFDAYLSFIDEGPTICTWGKEYSGTDYSPISVDITDTENFASVDLYNQVLEAYNSKKNVFIIYNGTILTSSWIKKEDSKIILIGEFTLTDGQSAVMRYILSVEIYSDGTGLAAVSQYGSGGSTPKVAGSATSGSSINYAREDHVHPAQTSVTGNAGTATKLQTERTINLTGDVTGAENFDGSKNIFITTTIENIDASKITSGTLNASRLPEIPIEKLPKGALERLVIVENQAARYRLTTSDVQEGDTVKQEDTGVMYFVVDTSNLANENGYKVYTAGAATSVPWSGVTGKPSTLEDYGVSATDSYLAKPTTFNWTGGTTAGPTGKLTGTNTDVSFPAIPAASQTASGIVTTGKQDFKGIKTFHDWAYFSEVDTEDIHNAGKIYTNYIGDNYLVEGATGDIDITPSSGNITVGGVPCLTNSGMEYTGNAATATKVKNKLTFTGAVTGSYDGSSALTVNIPEGGGEIPIALPNPYPVKFTGAVSASYDGSSSVTVNIPKTTMTYHAYPYSDASVGSNTGNGIDPGVVEYPSSWSSTSSSTFTIYVRANAFNANTPDAVVIVKGTRQVNLSFTSVNGWLVKQSNILTTGSASNAYRVYAFSYLGGSGSSTRVAVNCSEYIK